MASRQRLRQRGAAAAAGAAPPPVVVAPPAASSLVLGTLPAELALSVLLRLPLKERVAAEAVCRGWRAALRAPELWSRLDLSPLGGRVGDDLALSLAARAGAGLRSLDVSNCSQVTVDALLRCAAAVGEHPDAQLALRAPASWWSAKQIDDALTAFPHLSLVDIECYSDAVDASLLSALRSARGGVRLLLLSHWGHTVDTAPGAPPPATALAQALRGHPTLLRLDLDDGTFTTQEIAQLVRELRSPRAEAAEDDGTGAAEADAAAAASCVPSVLREVSLHGTTRATQLWDLERALAAADAGDAGSGSGVNDITVTAKNVRSVSVSPALLGVLRSGRVGMRELVIEEFDDDDEETTEAAAVALAAALRHASEHARDAATAGEASPHALQQGAAASAPASQPLLLPAAAVPTPEPALPLPGAAALVVFSIANCGIIPQAAVALLEALPAACPCLESLNLSDNAVCFPHQVGAVQTARLMAALQAVMCMPALRELIAERCGLDNCCAEGLARGLGAAAGPGGFNACRRLLLAHNVIGDAGAAALAQVVRARHAPALEELDLSENQVGGPGGSALAKALVCGGVLRELRAYGNRGGGADGVPVLVELLAAGPACIAAADAAGELGDAAFDSDAVQDALVAAGGVPRLLQLLAEPAEAPHGVAIACEEASWALWAVASESAANRAALCTAGAVPRLAATLAAADAGALSVPAAPPAEGAAARSAAAAARDVTEKVCAVLWCLASTDASRCDIAAAPGVIASMLRLATLPPGARTAARRAFEQAHDVYAQMGWPTAHAPGAGAAGGAFVADLEGEEGEDEPQLGEHVHDGQNGFWVMVAGQPAAPVPAASSMLDSHEYLSGSDSVDEEDSLVANAPPPLLGHGLWDPQSMTYGGNGARLRLMAIGGLTALALTPSLRGMLRSRGLLPVAEALARAGPVAADAATSYQALLAVLLLAAPRPSGPQPPAGDAALARELLRSTSVGRRAARHLAATLSATLAAARSGEPRDGARPPDADEGLYLECTWTVEEAAAYIAAAAQVCSATAVALLRRHGVGELLVLALRSGAGGPGAVVGVCRAMLALSRVCGEGGRDSLRRDGAVRALRAVARSASGAAGRAPPRALARTQAAEAQPDSAVVAAAARACLEALESGAERQPKGRGRKS